MGYDPLRCARAYLVLWKLVDRLFPDSHWLEITAFHGSELEAEAARLLQDPLTWCDEPNSLRESISAARKLSSTSLVGGVIGQAQNLRVKLRDRALTYAQHVQPSRDDFAEWMVTTGLVLTCAKCSTKNFLNRYPFWNFEGNTKCAGCDTIYAVKFIMGYIVSGPTASNGKAELLPDYAEDRTGAGITGEGKIRPPPYAQPDPSTGKQGKPGQQFRGIPTSDENRDKALKPVRDRPPKEK